MYTSRIASIEAIFLVLTIITNQIILFLPKNILDTTGSAAILNIIYIGILLFVLSMLLVRLFKHFTNSDIIDVSEFLGGKPLKIIIGILYISYFVFTSGILLRNFAGALKLTYFSLVPLSLLCLAILTVPYFINHLGYKSVVKSNLIIQPIMILSIVVIFAFISPKFTPEKIFPLFGNGLNETFFSGISNLFAFSGLAVLYFLMPLLEQKKNFKKITYVSMGISCILLLLSVTYLLFSAPFVASIHELSPMYLVIRIANFGSFLQRPDAIFIFIWLLSFMTYLSVNIMLASFVFKKLTNIREEKNIIGAICAIIFGISLLPKGLPVVRTLEYSIYKWSTLLLVFVLSFSILLLANMKYRKKQKNANLPKEGDAS